MSGIIACVCKSGGDFTIDHVRWLQLQCLEHMPDWQFQSWTDMGYGIRLKRNWPRWWSKMEIYNDLYEDPTPCLVVDLDTVFLKEFKILPEHDNELLIMRDPWKNGGRFPEKLGGGFMYLPQWARQEIWDAWQENPEAVMAACGDNDQVFLHKLFEKTALRIQDYYLDQIVSYKVHVQSMGLQDDNRVVYFHGQPRPWDVKESWIPELGV